MQYGPDWLISVAGDEVEVGLKAYIAHDFRYVPLDVIG